MPKGNFKQATDCLNCRILSVFSVIDSKLSYVSELMFVLMEFSMSVYITVAAGQDTEKCDHMPTNIHKLTCVSLRLLDIASGCFTGSDGDQINLTLTKKSGSSELFFGPFVWDVIMT